MVNACKIRINYGGLPLRKMNVYDLNGIITFPYADNPIFKSDSTSAIVSLPGPGDYFIQISLKNSPEFFVPYSLIITTFCDSLCVAPGTTAPACSIQTCGDAILD